MTNKSAQRDGMHIEWDVPIKMDDGIVLRCDIFRPIADGRYPVLLTYGPYGKGVAFQDGWTPLYAKLVSDFPEVAAGTTEKYQCWEVVDPEKWVPEGYVCIRVDSRGAGRSPGFQDIFSARETKDLYECIEWAGIQPWSNGKVGLNGVSYYAMNQWLVAALQPPHLAAICPWEGSADVYREFARHGGILSTFADYIVDLQIKRVQHGVGIKGPRSAVTGELAAGPATMREEQLQANRANTFLQYLEHELCDDFFKERVPDWAKVTVPILSSGNWGGQGIHLRGNSEGFMRAASEQKWLEMHGLEHWTHFYTDYGIDLQRRFFDHFLKGADNGWNKQPKVLLNVRHPGNRFVQRPENEWPLARTQWTKFNLHADTGQLSPDKPRPGSITYDALGDGLTFVTPPLEKETEVTGPLAAKLFISSSTEDADLFLVLRAFTADFKEISFFGVSDPLTPLANGWLRASHRKLDATLSKPYWPYHTHDELWKLTPNEKVELDIEIWPTSIVLPAGHRLALSILGRDYAHSAAGKLPLRHQRTTGPHVATGVSPFWHDDARDRPPSVFGGKVTVHSDSTTPSYLLLPIIPVD